MKLDIALYAVDFRFQAGYTAGMDDPGENLSWMTLAVAFIVATAGLPLLMLLLFWLVTMFA